MGWTWAGFWWQLCPYPMPPTQARHAFLYPLKCHCMLWPTQVRIGLSCSVAAVEAPVFIAVISQLFSRQQFLSNPPVPPQVVMLSVLYFLLKCGKGKILVINGKERRKQMHHKQLPSRMHVVSSLRLIINIQEVLPGERITYNKKLYFWQFVKPLNC